MKTNKSKKFKELKVGDVIYFCNCRGKFSKETILNGYVLKVKTFNVDRVETFTNLIKISDYHLGISLILKKNVMKHYTNYYIYSTSKEYIEKADYIIKIDHHDDSEEFGDIICVKNEEPANCQIITEFAVANNLNISEKAATALYTGLVTDTGRFQFRGVSQATFNAAGVLINTGIDVDNIYAAISLKDISSYKLQAYLYKNMKTTPNGVVYMYFTNKIMKKFKVSKEDAAALVSCMSSIKGSLFWITFVDYDENIRVRLRSRFMSINELGKKWRGGGHLQAAGATIYNKKEMKELLLEADNMIKKYKEEHPEAI